MLGLATPLMALTAARVLSKVLFCFHIRYAMASEALLETPCEQCSSTLPPLALAACAAIRWDHQLQQAWSRHVLVFHMSLVQSRQ